MAALPYFAPTYFPPSFFSIDAEAVSVLVPTGGMPYFTPTYFPPSFFSAMETPPTSTTVPTGTMPYNTPSYFPLSYFYTGASSSSSVVPDDPEPAGRDQAAYQALLGIIRDLGLFEDVILGSALQQSQAGAACYPLAVLTPKGWEESDETDPASVVRRTLFGITIVVQSQGGQPEYDQLDRLASSVVKVVNFVGLGPVGLPPLTRIRAGRYDTSAHYPEQSIELEGEFSSMIDSSNPFITIL